MGLSGKIWLGLASFGILASITACHPVERRSPRGSIVAHPTYSQIVEKLNCPDQEGGLVRTNLAADGRSCRYHGDGNEDVNLTLLALNGASPAQALTPVEADIGAAVPRGRGARTSAPSSTHGENLDHTRIDLPGLHIEADGDKAQVRLPGVLVDADGDNAKVHTGLGEGADIDADQNGAVIRTGFADRRGVNLTFVLSSDMPGPDGVKVAGYVARGPASGPLVLATFKFSTSAHGDRDDLNRLVDLNFGR